MAYDLVDWREELPPCPGCGYLILPEENVTIIHNASLTSSAKWHSKCSSHIWMPKWPINWKFPG